MGQTVSSTSETSAGTIGAGTNAANVVGIFGLTTAPTVPSILVNDGKNKYYTLPGGFAFQIQNGLLRESGALYLALRSFANGNFTSFTLPTAAIADVFGLTPTICSYYCQVCAINQEDYQLTLYITPTVSSNDPVSLLDTLAIREFVFVGDSSLATVNFQYVVYNKTTSCFVVTDASVTITCNYSPNGLIRALTLNDAAVTFDFVFNGNIVTSASPANIATIRPYIGQTTLDNTQVTQLNSGALYNLGNNYMGSAISIFTKVDTVITCTAESDKNLVQLGALDVNK